MDQIFKFLATSVLLMLSSQTVAESFFSQFNDDDGWVDASDFVLNNAVGFMPLPIVITEPALDHGIGVAAAFFHAPKEYAPDTDTTDEDEFVLPNITAVAGAVTGNDSWLIGGGHMAYWKDDTIRYEGMAGYASIHLEFFGFAGGAAFDDGIAFETEGFFTEHPFAFRWKDSNVFLGTSWDYYKLESKIDLGIGIPGIDPLELDTQLSGLDVFILYDTLDNPFTPNSGIEAQLSVGRKDEVIGSDFEYTIVESNVNAFWRLGSKFVLGLRFDTTNVSGDVPFFVVPFIDLRGIPAMRYQGEATLITETELRWSFHPRIGVVGFIGAGRAADSMGDISDAPSRIVRGLGIRYLAARKLGMHMGIDVAEGPDDTHWYLTFGQAW